MSYSLWLEGVCIGNVDAGASDASGELFGVLEPTAAYAAARPLLQRATLGLAALANLTGLAIHQHLVSVMEDLQSKGLTLRDERGVDVVAQFLLVGDYLPASVDMVIFGSHPPSMFSHDLRDSTLPLGPSRCNGWVVSIATSGMPKGFFVTSCSAPSVRRAVAPGR